jgi:NAD(P)-dependent dehydrogenase (short-subunit alcohol dehydrogenase family)
MSGLKDGLTDKVAVVTGASTPRGIGSAIARRFAAEGASVYLAAEGPADALESETEKCRATCRPGARVEFGVFDLGVAGRPEAMIEDALSRFGRVDVLVNNAGIRDHRAFGDVSRELFDQVVSVNLAAAFFASQAVLPAMRAQGGGRIIHIASQMGSIAHDKRSVYGLTKAALVHLTKSMAYELGAEGIIVNAISPGPILTQPILDRLDKEPGYSDTRMTYLRANRFGTPDEIAELAFYLAATDATYMQGANLLIDGGYTTH